MPALNSEDGQTRGTTSVAHCCHGPLPARNQNRISCQQSALSGGPGRSYTEIYPLGRRLKGDIFQGSQRPALIIPDSLYADLLKRGPRHCHCWE